MIDSSAYINEQKQIMIKQISGVIVLGFMMTVAYGQSCLEPDTKSTKRMKKDVVYLAHDKLEGREAASNGEALAAKYIIKRFEKLGLAPVGDYGYYKNGFGVPSVVYISDANTFSVNGTSLKLKDEFFPMPLSSNTTVVAGDLIHVGFGIEAPELSRNDYENVGDITGKVIVINYSSPDGVHPHSKYAKYHDLQTRIEHAVEKGAVGAVVYNPDVNLRNPPSVYKYLRPLGIPVVFITDDEASWLKEAGKVDIHVHLSQQAMLGQNVAGFHDNDAEKTIVIGAHYDHLGFGEEGSLHAGEKAIHNGADDNASGTAGLMELARFLTKSELKNNNYLFIAFSGEEKGLLGSKAFVKSGTYPMDKVNYMINMDMIGRLSEDKKLVINGVGTSPELKSAIESLTCYGFDIKTTESGVGPSDHTSFYLEDIPVLHFFSGTHKDYHKPSDDADKVNYEGMTEIIAYIESLIASLDAKGELTFTKTKEETNRNTPRFTVTLGVMPDYTYDQEGMKIDGVSDDKPAKKAGIKAGDVVLKMGEYPIRDMQSYMRALSLFKRGDKTKVIIQRDGKEMEMEIQF